MLAFISLYSLSPYKHGIQPAGRNILRCEKTSTHHDLIRGCCWKNSWLKRCGRPVSSKCAASERKKNHKWTGSNRLQAAENWEPKGGYRVPLLKYELHLRLIWDHFSPQWMWLDKFVADLVLLIRDNCLFVFSPKLHVHVLNLKVHTYIFFVCKCNMPWKYSRTRGWRVAWLRCSRPAGLVKSITEEKGNPWWWHASSHLLRYLLNERKSSNLR